MKTTLCLFAIFFCALISPACKSNSVSHPTWPAVRVFVTNEASGDLSVIDGERNVVIATLQLGKRPRGVHLSHDRKLLFVAQTRSPDLVCTDSVHTTRSKHSGQHWVYIFVEIKSRDHRPLKLILPLSSMEKPE